MTVAYKTSAKSFVASGQTVVVPKPVGSVRKDLLIFLGLKQTGAAGTWSLPTGWTQFEATSVGGAMKTVIASRIIEDSDLLLTDYAFTFTGGGNVQMNGILARIELALGIEGGANTSAANQPIVTMLCQNYATIADNVLVLRVPFYIFATTEPSSLTPPGGITQRELSDGPGSNDAQVAVFTDDALKTPPGTTGSATITAVGSSGNITGRFYTLGIEPSPSGIGGYLPAPLFKEADFQKGEPVKIPPGMRLKNPFRRIEDPWKELRRK